MKCCEKEMLKLPCCSPNQNRTESMWICGECGGIYVEYFEELDDEELDNYLDIFEDELKDTKIYKERKNGK